MKNITILGSTGTIGKNTLYVLDKLKNKYKIFALTANSNYSSLFKQIKKYKPRYAVLKCENSAEKLSVLCKKNKLKTRILCGIKEMNYVSCHKECTHVMSAIVGSAGLEPTFHAASSGKIIFLANKESLIMSGNLLIKKAKRNNSIIIPVDSEHNAIFQILHSVGLDYKPGISTYYKDFIDEIILTASGGPFNNFSRSKLKNVSPKEAIKHPIWKMGEKISIDSATMMNKGLELIEASILFGVKPAKIKIIIHPESIIHGMVVFRDGSIIAHMGDHDMKIPISFALSYPKRITLKSNKFDIIKLKSLSFNNAKKGDFKCLDLAYEALKIGKNAPIILNAANEVCVRNFLQNNIKFTDIPVIIEKALKEIKIRQSTTLKSILEDDALVRNFVSETISKKRKWK